MSSGQPLCVAALSFKFHYFALRKMHFMMRAKALVAFPGGFGTLDELFEVITLVQTARPSRCRSCCSAPTTGSA
jgi:predicted Rossmann-fold nucleotide-binding protein